MEEKRASRRGRLYGASRKKAREVAKRLQQEDHVLANFQKGTEPFDDNETFQSVTTRSFRHHPLAPSATSKWDSSAQNVTHLKFGSDMEPLTSVVRSDYTAKPIPEYKQYVPDGLHDVHLADMAPQYMADKSFGKSLYSSDFNGRRTYREWSSCAAQEGKKVGRRLKTTQYQKATHFELGSDPYNLESETSHCFTARDRSTDTALLAPPSGPGGVDRSQSNVFRAGDYNISSSLPRDHFLSVQQQDYNPPSRVQAIAGVSTATSKGYSHVFPRKSSGDAIGALRKLLVEKNTQEFQNPSDPTAINVLRAFLKYDKDRSGSITVDELKAVCTELGTPITEQEIAALLKECDQNRDGTIDYIEFTKYLTAHTEAQSTGEEFVSTHSDTYSRSSGQVESPEEDPFMGAQYQTSTHFQFGNHKKPSASIYSKDFGPESTRAAVTFLPAPPPPSSKVMHEFPVIASDTTTSRKDYIRYNIAAREGDRLSSLNTNRSKHENLAVVLSCDEGAHKDQYKSSTMGSSYVAPPPGTSAAHPVDPVPKDYHHLESNRALAHPPKGPTKSEVQACFGVPVKSCAEGVARRRAALEERTSRIKDNKHTHFILGFDCLPPLSEKMAEFELREPVNSGLPAAGKPVGPTQGYSVIGHDSGEPHPQSSEPHPPSSDSNQGVPSGLQILLQQRNFLRNVNPRDPLNVNLRKAFLEYDKDLSGTISREEVVRVCTALRVPVDERDLEDMITRCDKNGDGQIDYHEFALHLSRQQPPPLSSQLTTTTRKDFKHPRDQALSAMQRVVVEQDSKKHVPLHPTHFFHLDSSEDYLLSTTRKDFIPPEACH